MPGAAKPIHLVLRSQSLRRLAMTSSYALEDNSWKWPESYGIILQYHLMLYLFFPAPLYSIGGISLYQMAKCILG